jgi:hypothetical protein
MYAYYDNLLNACFQMKLSTENMDEAEKPVFEFEKTICKFCGIIYYECPECFYLLRYIAPHGCFNSFLENALQLNYRSRPGNDCLILCPSCVAKDGCQHRLRGVQS